MRLSVAELARLHVGLGCARPKRLLVKAVCAPVPLPLCAAVPTARVRGATCVLFRVRVLGAGVQCLRRDFTLFPASLSVLVCKILFLNS